VTRKLFLADPLPDPVRLDLLVTNIGQLCTVHDPARDGSGPRRGESLADVGAIADGALAVAGGRIVAAGAEQAVREALFGGREPEPLFRTVDVAGAAVVPGFVDPHTHAVFGRTRQDEYDRRIRGESYLEIAAAGGGIRASVRDLRERDEDQLAASAELRLLRLRRQGTTTLEIKSGYGLSLEDEVKSLRAARRAADAVGMPVVLTCLAAHEIPDEYRDRREAYVALVCEEILPQVAEEGLAERCDVFCEPSVFDLAETERIVRRAQDLGLRAALHADELEPMGGAALAARLGCDSADHLIKIDEAGIAALAGSETVATFLPGTVFTLGIRDYAPARRMIEAGCAVAVATDFNPGSCPIASMPLVQSIACSQMKMTPAEALVACTLNSAWALRRADEVGSLAPGKRADFVVLWGTDFRLVPYHGGIDQIEAVYQGGVRVV
jgi:imidazolonepropionase